MNESKKRKAIVYLIIVVGVLFLLLGTATFAYFATNTSNNFGTKTITGTADATGSVVLVGTNASLYLNIGRSLMAQGANDTTYWAVTTNTTPSTTQNVVTVGSTQVTGAGYYNCSYTLNVAASGTNNMYTAFQGMSGKSTEQIVLNIGGNTYDFNTSNLFPITVNGTLNGVTSSSVQNITAEFYLKNKSNVNQSALAGKDLSITITATSFTCTQLEDPNNYLDKTRFRNNYVNGFNSTTLVFMNTTNVPEDNSGCGSILDVSEKQNGSIMMSIDTNDCYYDDMTIYVGQNGGVLAPPDSSRLFESVRDAHVNWSNLDTSHVTDMSLMFYGIYDVTNINNLNTSNVVNMSSVFLESGDCDNPGPIDLTGWNTSRVTRMNNMFDQSCYTAINLGSFNTANVTDMANMFYASTVTTIYASSNFVTTSLGSGYWGNGGGYVNGGGDNMFLSAYNLVGGNGTHFDDNHIDELYARIDAPGTPGYFTAAS